MQIEDEYGNIEFAERDTLNNIIELYPGIYKLTLFAEDMEPVVIDSIKIEKNSTQLIEKEFYGRKDDCRKTVEFNTFPDGADTYLNGKNIEDPTPTIIVNSSGLIVFKKNGYKPYVDTICSTEKDFKIDTLKTHTNNITFNLKDSTDNSEEWDYNKVNIFMIDDVDFTSFYRNKSRTLNLTKGYHKIIIEAEGFKKLTKTILVKRAYHSFEFKLMPDHSLLGFIDYSEDLKIVNIRYKENNKTDWIEQELEIEKNKTKYISIIPGNYKFIIGANCYNEVEYPNIVILEKDLGVEKTININLKRVCKKIIFKNPDSIAKYYLKTHSKFSSSDFEPLEISPLNNYSLLTDGNAFQIKVSKPKHKDFIDTIYFKKDENTKTINNIKLIPIEGYFKLNVKKPKGVSAYDIIIEDHKQDHIFDKTFENTYDEINHKYLVGDYTLRLVSGGHKSGIKSLVIKENETTKLDIVLSPYLYYRNARNYSILTGLLASGATLYFLKQSQSSYAAYKNTTDNQEAANLRIKTKKFDKAAAISLSSAVVAFSVSIPLHYKFKKELGKTKK
ncbi:MAG: hypothetical protein JEZ09_07865 [Salinivirgaceae bacterium]|nr:hypothetical protein [Salinivirgaceae bacterium]